jgi:hypothetical protein
VLHCKKIAANKRQFEVNCEKMQRIAANCSKLQQIAANCSKLVIICRVDSVLGAQTLPPLVENNHGTKMGALAPFPPPENMFSGFFQRI